MAKRFYKVEKDSQVFGVCQGIAEYFDIDPSLVRIAFVVSILFFGTGLLFYIVLGIILPEKKTIQRNYRNDDIYESFDDDDY